MTMIVALFVEEYNGVIVRARKILPVALILGRTFRT